MNQPALDLLIDTRAVALVDWPHPSLPEALARTGRDVWVKDGPGEQDWSHRTMRDGLCLATPTGTGPQSVDLLYAFRPLPEFESLVELAVRLGARAIWYQSGLGPDGARDLSACWLDPSDAAGIQSLAQAASLVLVHQSSLADAIARLPTDSLP